MYELGSEFIPYLIRLVVVIRVHKQQQNVRGFIKTEGSYTPTNLYNDILLSQVPTEM